MFRDNDLIEVYNEYEHNIYMPTQMKNGLDYVAEGIGENGEVIPCYVSWGDVKYINKISSVFRTGKLRFGEEQEQEAIRGLRIDVSKFYYPRYKIKEMILDASDDVIKEILEIKDIRIINNFIAVLVGLENSNEYDISGKLALYLRARQEELENGVIKTELKITPTKSNKGKGKKNKEENEE